MFLPRGPQEEDEPHPCNLSLLRLEAVDEIRGNCFTPDLEKKVTVIKMNESPSQAHEHSRQTGKARV